MNGKKIAAIGGACFLAFGAVCLLVGKLIGGTMNYNYVVGGNGIESKTIKANTTSDEIEYNDVVTEKLITNSTSADFKGNGVKANIIDANCTSGEVEIVFE